MTKKKFLILHMGGTIGMKMTPDGLAAPENSEEYKKAILPDLVLFKDKLDFDFVSLSTVDSNNINPEALEELVAYIRAYEDQYDGILITHGTDTLASTAAALNVAFHNHDGRSLLSTPIVMTAAQTSTVPSEQVAHAAKFLPKPETDRILRAHKEINFVEATGWTPAMAA